MKVLKASRFFCLFSMKTIIKCIITNMNVVAVVDDSNGQQKKVFDDVFVGHIFFLLDNIIWFVNEENVPSKIFLTIIFLLNVSLDYWSTKLMSYIVQIKKIDPRQMDL